MKSHGIRVERVQWRFRILLADLETKRVLGPHSFRPSRHFIALAFGALLVWFASAARAEGPESLREVRLAFVRGEGAEACLSERELADRVRERIGRDPFSDRANTSIEGYVRRDGEKLRATVRVRREGESEASGLRDLESDELDCAALGKAVTLAVALAIDPEAALGPPKPATPAAEPAQKEPTLPPPRKRPPEPARSPARAPASLPRAEPPAPQRQGDFSARAILSSGLLPNWAAGVSVVGHRRVIDRFAGMVGLTYLPEVKTDTGRAAFGLSAASLGGCYALVEVDLDGLDACAGFELGSLHSVVYEDKPRHPGDKLWLAAAGSLRAAWAVRKPWLIELGVGLGVPLIRHRFVVKGEPGAAFSPSPVVGQGFVGAGLVF